MAKRAEHPQDCATCARINQSESYLNTPRWVYETLKHSSKLKSFYMDFIACFGGFLNVELDSVGKPTARNQGLHIHLNCMENIMRRSGIKISATKLEDDLAELVKLGIFSKATPAQHSSFARIYLINRDKAHQYDDLAKTLAVTFLNKSKYAGQTRVKNEVVVETELDQAYANIAEQAAGIVPEAKKQLFKNLVFTQLSEGRPLPVVVNAMWEIKTKIANGDTAIKWSAGCFQSGLNEKRSYLPAQVSAEVDKLNRELIRLKETSKELSYV